MKRLKIMLLLVVGGCGSHFTKMVKNPDMNKRIQAAFQYYENKDYAKAGLLLEEVLPNIVGNKFSEKVQFYYAYCQYYQDQFELSAHYFNSFYNIYRRSDHAEEAYFMYAFSLYQTTPAFNLDQSNTSKAINAMQEFLNLYPKSTFSLRASNVIQTLQNKLEQKAYEICKQYLRLRQYKAGVISSDNFQKDFPDSDYNEEISYLKIDAQYNFGRLSIQKLKRKRIEETIAYYYLFIEKYPESQYLKKAEKIFENCRKEIPNLNKSTF